MYTAVGTLDHYIQLTSELPLEEKKYSPTPYWTGFYASRPILKNLHYEAVNGLLGAEVAEALLAVLNCNSHPRSQLEDLWEQVATSTHHDYITGTAVDEVYTKEQLPLSTSVRDAALGARRSALDGLAACVASQHEVKLGGNERAVLIFNAQGFTVKNALVELPIDGSGVSPSDFVSVRFDQTTWRPLQFDSRKNVLIFQAPSLPALSYTTAYLSTEKATASAKLKVNVTGFNVYMSNDALSAQIGGKGCSSDWSISSLVDARTKQETLAGCSNRLLFHADAGHIYQFAHESGGLFPMDKNGVFKVSNVVKLEDGPVRVAVQGTLEWTSQAWCEAKNYSARYIVQYSLVADEPFLRVSVEGRAPQGSNPDRSCGYTVLSSQTFGKGVAQTLVHGTSYHWSDFQPEDNAGYTSPVFRSTHDFVIVQEGTQRVGTLLHDGTPAWAVHEGQVIGALFRNSPRVGVGAKGSDGVPTTQYFALRLPSGVISPAQAPRLLQESRAFRNPAQAHLMPHTRTGGLQAKSAPASLSIASLDDERAMISSCKLGSFAGSQLVLRVYQPTNGVVSTQITVQGAWQAHSASALEFPGARIPLRTSEAHPFGQVSWKLDLPRALHTVVLSQVKE